jgi:N utilization substance protein B
VFTHVEEIDGYISRYSRARSFRRLSKVVLAALRLAIYEILYVDDLEPRISINEAVELAKTFSGKDEAGFVNGVLGGFMKAYSAGEIKPQGDAPSENTDGETAQ